MILNVAKMELCHIDRGIQCVIIASELFDLECGHWDSCVSMYVACVAQLKISGVVLTLM